MSLMLHEMLVGGVTLDKTPIATTCLENLATKTSFSFTSDVGTPDASRVIVLCVMGNYVPGFISSITVNGVAGTSVVNSGRTAQHCEIWRVSLPAGSGVVPIVVTFPGATQGCAVSTYVTYPSSPVPVDALGTNNKVSTLTLTDLAKTAGGFGVFITCSNVSGKDCHVTMTGETVTKGCNSLHSAGSKSYQFYLMNPVATTSATGDPVATWSGSSPVAFVGATWY